MPQEYSQALCQERAEVEAILASELLKRAPNLCRILSYISDKYSQGEVSKIKEYNIGVEALNRGVNFDPKRDASVRVEASRLRKRLREYYQGEGADHQLQLVLPAAGYVPHFIRAAAGVRETGNREKGNGEPAARTVPASQLRTALASRRWVLAGCGLLVIAALTGSRGLWRRAPAAPAIKVAAETGIAASGPLEVPPEGVRILTGYTRPHYVDGLGRLWLGDQYFVGGSPASSPGSEVLGVLDPTLYRFARRGDFRYDIPLKPGIYELHLLFAETLVGQGNRLQNGERSRVFHVAINGVRRLAFFDIMNEAGSADIPADRFFTDVGPAPDGYLHVQFAPVNDLPQLNGIELLPGLPGRMHPIRIAAGGRAFCDRSGRLWDADRYFLGGRQLTGPTLVSGTADPELFRSERWGHFSYSIPVAPEGRYTLALRFAETEFGPSNPDGGGVGSRLFDVYCNGVALLRDFDIYKEAGGADRAIDRVFTGIKPNPQSHLLLSFIPVRHYATVRALEVMDERH